MKWHASDLDIEKITYSEEELERKVPERSRVADERSAFEIDRSRVIHSAAFRRLQGKTQVFGMGESDFFRTRLTHSLEVAQIGKGLALRLGASPELVEAAALIHDIGHPPFGHVGEEVLKRLMWDNGGFEASTQNLRVIGFLEAKSSSFKGLNLTRATIDAILKYKESFSHVKKRHKKYDAKTKTKFYYDVDEKMIRFATEGSPRTKKSFDCQIMEWADDIAYSTHDLEDGIRAGMITAERLNLMEGELRDSLRKQRIPIHIWNEAIEIVKRAASKRRGDSEFDKKARRKGVISDMISRFIRATNLTSASGKNNPPRYCRDLVIDSDSRSLCNALVEIVWQLIISDERLATLERKAEIVVEGLFNELTKDEDWRVLTKLYPADFRERFEDAKYDSSECYRLACDYISGMTDAYAIRVYSRLTQPETHSLLEML